MRGRDNVLRGTRSAVCAAVSAGARRLLAIALLDPFLRTLYARFSVPYTLTKKERRHEIHRHPRVTIQHRHRRHPSRAAYRGHSPMDWWILTSRRWLTGPADQRLRHRAPRRTRRVRHRPGPRLGHRPGYFPDGPTGLIYRRLAEFQVNADETLTAGLERLGYHPADVTTAVISHLHQDHIGGVGEISHAELSSPPTSGAR